MLVFQSPENPFIHPAFVDKLKKYCSIKYINNIPTIKDRTFFWSIRLFPGIKGQFIIKPEKSDLTKRHFFVQTPRPYRDVPARYSKHFRNRLKKSRESGLSLQIINQPDQNIIQNCYNIYQTNMDRLKTFSFSYNFFNDLATLPYCYFWTININNKIVSFALMLGNLMFIQSSNQIGRQNYANNFLYDSILKNLENNYVFFGISCRDNHGLEKFKLEAGLDMWAAQETSFDVWQHVPKFFRNNRLIWLIIKTINGDHLVKHLLPY